MFFDFYIPELRIFIEVHGEQHYSYSKFYHNSAADFEQQKIRDAFKEEWCSLNDYKLVVFSFKEVLELTPKSFLHRIING
jgi:very-short-patch-repair endonuclease